MTEGVTVIVAVIGEVPVLIAEKLPISPEPEAANPIEVVLFVHVKVPPEGVLAKLVAATVPPLQTSIFDGTVTVGVGLTVILYEEGVPVHPLAVGVTVIVAVIEDEPVFVAVKLPISPEPFASRPIAVLLFVQANVAPEVVLEKEVAATVAPLQTVIFEGTVTTGVGYTVIL